MKTRKRTRVAVVIELDADDPLLWERDAPQYKIDAASYQRAADLLDPVKAVAKAVSPHVKSVDAIVEYEEVCSHCGFKWELDDEGCPCCCNKAISEHESAKATAVDNPGS